MRSFLVAGALLAASASANNAGCHQDGGNWYCKLVQKITYTGMGKPGSYSRITNMADGACDKETYSYSGPMSPLDEDLSIHFRGPLNLRQFAAYAPQSSAKVKRTQQERRHAHGHQHFHKRNKEIREIQERAVGDMVTATIDGIVQTWKNTWDGGAGLHDDAPAAAPAETTEVAVAKKPAAAAVVADSSPKSSSSDDDDEDDDTPVAAGDWARVAYYTGAGGKSEGLVALNNKGGGGSGVFDYVYGNSLSYATSDGDGCASAPQQFAGNLSSNQEVAFFSDSKCDKSSCGYYRPGTVAYKGWAGSSKAFFFEFDMPYDGDRGFNGDMPAIWALNGQIPRTAQYNGCSCWDPASGGGCGEFDIIETLSSGSNKAKSTFHGKNAGGSSDYFARPVEKCMKLAVLFNGDKIHVEELDDDFDFANALSSSTVDGLCSDKGHGKNKVASLFALGS